MVQTWNFACHVSKHCPTSVCTYLMPGNPVLTTFAFKYAFKEYLLVLLKCHVTKPFYHQNVQLPNHPITKMSFTKTSTTKVSFTKMSGHPLTYSLSVVTCSASDREHERTSGRPLASLASVTHRKRSRLSTGNIETGTTATEVLFPSSE